jgi:hypothetical protein
LATPPSGGLGHGVERISNNYKDVFERRREIETMVIYNDPVSSYCVECDLKTDVDKI